MRTHLANNAQRYTRSKSPGHVLCTPCFDVVIRNSIGVDSGHPLKLYHLIPRDIEMFPIPQVLKTVKGLEKKGYTFEGADASVSLLVRRTMSGYVAPFK